METIHSHLTKLNEKVRAVETFYQSLPSKLFHQRLPSRITQLLSASSSNRTHQYQTQSSFAFQVISNPAQYGIKEDSEHLLLLRLHVLVDDAIDILSVLQSMVLCKYTQERDRQKKQSSKENLRQISIQSDDGLRRDREEERESGREGKGKESAEHWFRILISKYHEEYGTQQHDQHDTDLLASLFYEEENQQTHPTLDHTTWSTEKRNSTDVRETEITILHPNYSSVKCRPPLGLFCTFLSCCVIGEIDCTNDEWKALMKVSILLT